MGDEVINIFETRWGIMCISINNSKCSKYRALRKGDFSFQKTNKKYSVNKCYQF